MSSFVQGFESEYEKTRRPGRDLDRPSAVVYLFHSATRLLVDSPSSVGSDSPPPERHIHAIVQLARGPARPPPPRDGHRAAIYDSWDRPTLPGLARNARRSGTGAGRQ